MDCGLDTIYDEIQSNFHGRGPRCFDCLYRILKGTPVFETCDEFLHYLHPELNRLFSLVGLIRYNTSLYGSDYLLFRLKKRNTDTFFVLKAEPLQNTNAANEIQYTVLLHVELMQDGTAPTLVRFQTNSVHMSIHRGKAHENIRFQNEYVLVNTTLGIAFTVLHHFDNLFKNVSLPNNVYTSKMIHNLMDCLMSLHNHRIYIVDAYSSLTYDSDNGFRVCVSNGARYDELYELLQKLFPTEHEYVTLYPILEHYFFLDAIDSMGFKKTPRVIRQYLKSKQYRIDPLINIWLLKKIEKIENRTSPIKEDKLLHALCTVKRRRSSYKEHDKQVYTLYPYERARSLFQFLIFYKTLAYYYIQKILQKGI